MNWRQHIESRTITPEQAISMVRPGNRIVTGHAAGSPEVLIKAMMEHASSFKNVEIVHMVALNGSPYSQPQYEKNFRFNGIYASAGTREAIGDGRADFTTMFFSEFPAHLRDPGFPIDFAFITVSPPNNQGLVSLGVAVDYTMQAALSAKVVVAVINPTMPYIGGGALLAAHKIHHFVNSSLPILEIPVPVVGPVEQAIGDNIGNLIQDGDCLQLGIGTIPDAVLNTLGAKRDLGIHSEMVSDGVMKLVEAGVINCARKTLHQGKIVISFAMGSKGFYEWLDKNPMVEAYPVDYVNDPRVIGKNDNLISINSALSVDFFGQVAADCMGGGKQYSGVGGQVDFVRGSRFSKNGRSIIALPSTAAKGTASRICAMLEPGQPVTTSRNDVDYVVTEHGVAKLRGQTNAARAKALISLAAPQFREGLLRQARDLYKLRLS